MDLTEEQALAEWKRKFIKKWHGPNSIDLVNKQTAQDDSGKTIINPKFGKAFMHWTEVSKDDAEEILELEEEVIYGETEFLPVRIRSQAISPFDDSKPLYNINETDPFKDIRIVDQNDNVIHDGPWDSKLYDNYGIKITPVIYVYIKRNVEIDLTRLFRWQLPYSSGKHWKVIKKELDKVGRPMTFKVAGVSEEQNGSNKYNEFHFATGSSVPVLIAVEAMKKVNEVLISPQGKKPASLPQATPHATLAPSYEPKKQIEDIDYDSPLTDPKVKKAKEQAEMAAAVADVPTDLPFN